MTSLILALGVLLASAKLGGELLKRINQPPVLGELLAGVALGNLALVNPAWTFFEPLRVNPIVEYWAIVLQGLSQIGVIILLFEVGLETSVAEMRRVGTSSLLVALAGVIAPFVLGYCTSWMFIKEVPSSLRAIAPYIDTMHIHMFVGATLCATSVGITARVFQDLGKTEIKEARIILGAAVIDDVLGLIALAAVSSVILSAESGRGSNALALLRIIMTAIGVLAGSLIVGRWVVPKYMRFASQLKSSGLMLTSSIIFCFALSYLASVAGLAPIIGAFAAGLVLEEVHFSGFRENRSLPDLLRPLATVLVPLFFVIMGLQVRLEAFGNLEIVGIALAITLAAIIGKQICGLAVTEKGIDRLTVGLGMVPRGEVGLIFASIGVTLRVVDQALFSAIVLMVVLTTLVTPSLLSYSLRRIDHRKASDVKHEQRV